VEGKAEMNENEEFEFRLRLERESAAPAPSPDAKVEAKPGRQFLGNVGAGLVRGAGSIGATLLTPLDAAARAMGVQNSVIGRTDRRQAMDEALQGMGAQPDSLAYQGGKLTGEIAGTAGVGGTLARGAMMLPGAAKAAPLVDAIGSAGFKAGGMTGIPGVGVRAAGGGITGAASAGLVNPEDAKTGGAIGAAIPPALALGGKVGQKIGGALRQSVTPEVAALATRAKELGIDIPADRLVNSRPLNAVAAGLNYTPFSGRAATEARMGEQLNQAASRLMGQNTPNINQALRKASEQLGSAFDDTLRSNGVALDRELLESATEVVNRARNELGDDAFRAIDYKFRQLMEKGATGTIDGQAAYVIKRDLDRIGRGNSPNAFHALELKGALMEALNRSLGPDKAAGFAKVRQQYGNMLALEKLAKNGVEGEISVARLANLTNINNKPLQELADIAAQFVKPREGQHGAAQRALIGVGAGVVGGPASLAGGVAVGRGMNSLLNSNTLRNQMLGVQGPRNALMDPALQGLYRAAPLIAGGR
jgi:hypothetical protein